EADLLVGLAKRGARLGLQVLELKRRPLHEASAAEPADAAVAGFEPGPFQAVARHIAAAVRADVAKRCTDGERGLAAHGDAGRASRISLKRPGPTRLPVHAGSLVPLFARRQDAQARTSQPLGELLGLAPVHVPNRTERVARLVPGSVHVDPPRAGK